MLFYCRCLRLLYFIETNARILFDKGATKTIVSTTKENLDSEDFCEDASVVVGSIKDSISTISNFKALFLELEKFSFVLALLDKYSKNSVICENSTMILASFFANVRNFRVTPGNNVEKELSVFIDLNGIEIMCKILKEQIFKKVIVANCISIFCGFSRNEGNHNFFALLNSFHFPVL